MKDWYNMHIVGRYILYSLGNIIIHGHIGNTVIKTLKIQILYNI